MIILWILTVGTSSQEILDDESSELQAIKKQQAELALKEKRLMAKLAAKKIASKQDSKIEKLKQELAAAEAAKKGGSSSSDSDSDSSSSDKSSNDAAEQSTVQSLVTANDFKKLPEPVAKTADKHIATEAGIFSPSIFNIALSYYYQLSINEK